MDGVIQCGTDRKDDGALVHAGQRMAHLKEDDPKAVRVHSVVVVRPTPSSVNVSAVSGEKLKPRIR
jgi:hypothetical protein